ncbi:hypothetical protein CMT41_15460 [Colwellia sp. MT41]|uniref:glycosyltransferase n=1 Tax=Colwellia sp. MT41 TaxID=58049 RepID=UPI000717A989|nr:glycosyltransferase [Colwellia sp. MT41]ALO35964.1 hypothetical protein CMT41_15460 [Colwellia sp. MT41]
MSNLSNKKNLLVLASTYPRWLGDHEPGFVHELAKRLTDTFNVIIICPHADGAEEHETLEGVSVFRYHYAPKGFESLVNDGGIVSNLKKSPWKLLLLPLFFVAQLLLIRKVIKQKSIDVVHAHWLIPQGLALALLSKVIKLPPFLVTSHGADLFALKGRLFKQLKSFVARRATHLSVVSSVMKTELMKLGVKKDKISVMPMGVNMQSFSINTDILRSKNEILFVGRLVEKKGLCYLISAMPEIIKQQPSAYLTIIGFGPEEKDLKEQVKTLNLENKIIFKGAITQRKLAQYYQCAALFVAPFIEAKSGDQEGLGLVLVEALACGCPVVVSDIPACSDVIAGMCNVMVFPSTNTPLLAKVVSESLTEDKILSEENLIKLRDKFSWQEVTRHYSNKLESIINHDPN